MQDEELRGTRRELEVALANYTELFDFSPIGYAAIAQDESIREINDAGARLLARPRSTLVGTKFRAYVGIAAPDQWTSARVNCVRWAPT